jgi:permease
MTAGYCGTLMTPMAANFNIVPASILEIKDKNRIIKTQLPMGLTMLVIHIIFMILLFKA